MLELPNWTKNYGEKRDGSIGPTCQVLYLMYSGSKLLTPKCEAKVPIFQYISSVQFGLNENKVRQNRSVNHHTALAIKRLKRALWGITRSF